MEGLYQPFPPPPGAMWHPLNPSEARIVQRRLQELGYYRLPAEGIWGLASREALRDFKAAHGLAADDELDAETQAVLLRTDTVPAAATPFGQWAAQGQSCSGPGTYKMVVSPRAVQAGPVECEVRPALARSLRVVGRCSVQRERSHDPVSDIPDRLGAITHRPIGRRPGHKQVTVKHVYQQVNVQEGGQAVVGGEVNAGRGRCAKRRS